MENVLSRFELRDAVVFEKHTRKVEGTECAFSRQEEAALYKLQIFECNGKFGPYKALKIIVNVDNKLKELNPWPVLDYKSQKRVYHGQEINPMYVRFYISENLETGTKANRVEILPHETMLDEAKALEYWNSRPE